jgi:hypothetical protein
VEIKKESIKRAFCFHKIDKDMSRSYTYPSRQGVLDVLKSLSVKRGNKQMKMSRLIAAITVAVVALGSQVYAAPTITITAPTITFSVPATATQIEKDAAAALTTQFKTTLDNNVATMQTKTNDSLKAYGSQTKLAQGFANANLYSSQASSLQGYQGYDLFAVAGGVMVGLQAPDLNMDANAISDKIVKEGDLYAGIVPAYDYLNIGVHAGPIFGFFNKDLGETMKNFYFNIKFGGINYNYDIDADTKLKMQSTNFGLGVNYQILPGTPSILFGLFKWRGVSLGSGLTFQSNTVDVTLKLSEFTQSVASSTTSSTTTGGVTVSSTATTSGTMRVTPIVNLGIDASTFSIPLEATTSVQLLWLANLNFGLGADLVFGSAKINATANGAVSIPDFLATVTTSPSVGSVITGKQTAPGSFKLDASTPSTGADLARIRLMTGLGFNFGPVKLDIPVYYYLTSGLAFGITGAIVW